MDNKIKVRFFNPGLGYQKHKEEFDGEIQRVLSAGDLILRQDVETFEKSLAEYVGTKYAVALNSGTDALYLAVKALGIGPGDQVLVPSHTFVATAQVVAQVGATPVLYDMGEDLQSLLKIIRPKAIMVAHIAGEFMCDMTKLPKDIPIIEDACQSLGAIQNGKKAGAWGIAGAFSFYPAKILGAYGDGGALVTNDEAVYNYAIEARNHFKTDYSQWGINSRLDNLQAVILNIKLKHLEDTQKRRKEIAEKYLKELQELDDKGKLILLPKNTEGRVWQDFVFNAWLMRDKLYKFLKANDIETMINDYPFPIQKRDRSLAYEAQTLRLPINELLSDEEVDYVIAKIKEFYGA